MPDINPFGWNMLNRRGHLDKGGERTAHPTAKKKGKGKGKGKHKKKGKAKGKMGKGARGSGTPVSDDLVGNALVDSSDDEGDIEDASSGDESDVGGGREDDDPRGTRRGRSGPSTDPYTCEPISGNVSMPMNSCMYSFNGGHLRRLMLKVRGLTRLLLARSLGEVPTIADNVVFESMYGGFICPLWEREEGATYCRGGVGTFVTPIGASGAPVLVGESDDSDLEFVRQDPVCISVLDDEESVIDADQMQEDPPIGDDVIGDDISILNEEWGIHAVATRALKCASLDDESEGDGEVIEIDGDCVIVASSRGEDGAVAVEGVELPCMADISEKTMSLSSVLEGSSTGKLLADIEPLREANVGGADGGAGADDKHMRDRERYGMQFTTAGGTNGDEEDVGSDVSDETTASGSQQPDASSEQRRIVREGGGEEKAPEAIESLECIEAARLWEKKTRCDGGSVSVIVPARVL